MSKMWAGRTAGETEKIADDFNSSIPFDSRMYRQDIEGSIAHSKMLSKCGIISESDSKEIIDGLEGILSDIESGELEIDMTCEDIHMFVEQVLTSRIGDTGKKLHTARSRNDQVALDIRLYLRKEIALVTDKLKSLVTVISEQAEANMLTIMPGYTHLQRAQPVSFAHQILTYAMMLLRDISRFGDCSGRLNVSPIGSCALAGTTYATDRRYEASLLGFDSVCQNSIDGVSDRDFCVEFLSDCAMLMMHLSRFSEELVMWSSWEFSFIELSDAFTTGSSIMPQKKNPDMAELIRGKTGRVYGDLVSLLTVLKGLPLAYNKDMQEDKESVFDALDTVKMCLDVMIPMIKSMKVKPENMKKAASRGFINATDLADYLVTKGLPFRSAYKVSGGIVAYCIANEKVLEELTLDEYRTFSDIIEEDIYGVIDLEACLRRRVSEGGPSPESVPSQIEFIKSQFSN